MGTLILFYVDAAIHRVGLTTRVMIVLVKC